MTNTATLVEYTTKTTDAGLYSVPYLESGTYDISVTKEGFQDETIHGLLLNPSEIAKADVQLHVGAVTSVVEVQAATETLQTESSTITAGLSTHEMESIPNITLNPLYYVTLENNVVPRVEAATSQTIQSAGVGVAGRAELSAIGVNGGRAFENDIQIDGLPDTGDGFNEMTIVPNIEGLQQSQVISNNFTADYGHGQSVLEMTTRSGTNEYHGQVNFLFRNQVLDANTWGNKLQGIGRSDFQRSNAGGAIGGPILRNKCSSSRAITMRPRIREGQTLRRCRPAWSGWVISRRLCSQTRRGSRCRRSCSIRIGDADFAQPVPAGTHPPRYSHPEPASGARLPITPRSRCSTTIPPQTARPPTPTTITTTFRIPLTR